jgi:MarR family protein
MIKITLKREIKGKDFVKEMEKKYGSIEKLEELCKKHDDDPLIALDLDDWEYFKDHPDEVMEDKKIIYDLDDGLPAPDLTLLTIIKNKKPKSISDLAKMINKDSANVTKQVNKLKEKGLIGLEEGSINNVKIPVFNYDKIEIAI